MKKRYGARIALGAFAIGVLVMVLDNDEYERSRGDGEPDPIHTWEGDSEPTGRVDPTADDRDPLPFPTPGSALRYKDPGWDLVEYAVLLCLAEELALSAEDESIAETIALLEDAGGAPPEDLQGFHDGLVAELRGLSPLSPSTVQHMAGEAFAQAEEHPLLAEVMSFPCDLHYETIGQAMEEISGVMEYGMPLCFAWEDLLWNEEGALEGARCWKRKRWPEDLQGLHAELVTSLKALPEDAPREIVEAAFRPVQAYPALMYAMPCVISAGVNRIEFGLGEEIEAEILDYRTDVCGARDIALEGGPDGKYGAIEALEGARPPYGLPELHEHLVAYLVSLPDTFTENHAVEAFEIVGGHSLIKDALACELGDDVPILPQ